MYVPTCYYSYELQFFIIVSMCSLHLFWLLPLLSPIYTWILVARRELAKSEFLTLLNQYTAEKKANASRLLDLQLDLTQV